MIRSLVGGLVLLMPAVAAAQAPCPPRQDAVDYLAREFAEAPVAMGVATNGGLIEVLTAEDGSTWTILITLPDGSACMIAAGTDWQGLAPVAVMAPEAEPGA